ncbi:replication initiator protein RepSA [Streptacidiphilus cavernicola]|uniref:Replication initiator protein RepSA n=1 Tax=Streptacidiphilus cavernicola TaxID=3342716 RepID=A0ABV6VU25_9ACTN
MTAPLDPLAIADLTRVASRPDFARWHWQMQRTGGCAHPIRIAGWRRTVDRATGSVVAERSYSTVTEPGGVLRLACGNRRASRCPSCARTYAGDTFHLIRAGLTGDATKGVPADVRSHPRVFATLTAPSFGRVHNVPKSGRCRCGARHTETDARLGTPLDARTYDYAGAVLWNNYAGDLWRYFSIYLRREVARRVGLSQTALTKVCRISFAKVAEFQRRGAVHFHAIVRLDGPGGPGDTPPSWATATLLNEAIRTAAAAVSVPVDAAGDRPALRLGWGQQVDVHEITGSAGAGELTEEAVAGYVAKYATKAAETTETVDRRIGELSELDKLSIPDHTRRLIEACWALEAVYPKRLLEHWSHMLGFRGHFSSKSRHYSVTLGELRKTRADWRARQEHRERGLPEDGDDSEGSTLVLAHWRFAGAGLTPGESMFAATIARDLAANREIRKELQADWEEEESWQTAY